MSEYGQSGEYEQDGCKEVERLKPVSCQACCQGEFEGFEPPNKLSSITCLLYLQSMWLPVMVGIKRKASVVLCMKAESTASAVQRMKLLQEHLLHDDCK